MIGLAGKQDVEVPRLENEGQNKALYAGSMCLLDISLSRQPEASGNGAK